MRPPASNPAPQISIGRLNLRVPGHDKAGVTRIAQRLAERLAQASPGLPGQHLGVLQLRLTLPPGSGEDEVATLVSEAILQRLSQNRHA